MLPLPLGLPLPIPSFVSLLSLSSLDPFRSLVSFSLDLKSLSFDLRNSLSLASLSCDGGELGEGGASGGDASGEDARGEENERFWLLKVLLRELRDAVDEGLRGTASEERKASRPELPLPHLALDSELKRLAGSEDGDDGEVLLSSWALGLEPRKPLLLDLLRLSDVGTVSVLHV